MDYLNLNSFLDFGYFLKYDNAKMLIDISLAEPDKYKDVSYDEIVKIGTKLYRDAVDNLYDSNKEHCVPLSGGVDSRMVLAGLLECTEAQNVHTYTFGVPGALDYEIGQMIAKKIGTKHTQINLNDCVYTQDELLEISRRMDMQTIVFLTPPLSAIRKFEDMDVWSGFLGDVVLGITFHPTKNCDQNVLLKEYLRMQQYVKSIRLSNSKYNEFFPLIDGIDTLSSLELSETIRYCNGHVKNTFPNVCMSGFEYKIPAIDQELVYYAFSIADEYRFGDDLRLAVLSTIDSVFLKYPLKNKLGLNGNAPKFAVTAKRAICYAKKKFGISTIGSTNYQDFNTNIIQKPYLQELVRNNIYDLESRNIIPWIKPSKIFEDHLAGKGKYGDALIVLTSLEIHLKNGKMP